MHQILQDRFMDYVVPSTASSVGKITIGYAQSALKDRSLSITAWVLAHRYRWCDQVFLVANETQSKLLLEALTSCIGGQGPVVVHLPGWQNSPYLPSKPSIVARHERLQALFKAAHHPDPVWVVTTLEGLLQYTLSYQALQELSVSLHLGSDHEYDRGDLEAQLLMAGYHRMDPVCEPGTYKLRGEILDIFPLHTPYPVRIRFFDTSIESMYYYDAQSQKHTSITLDHLHIGPAKEVVFTGGTYQKNYLDALKMKGQLQGLPFGLREQTLQDIRHGIYRDDADFWPGLLQYAQDPTCLESGLSFLKQCAEGRKTKLYLCMIYPTEVQNSFATKLSDHARLKALCSKKTQWVLEPQELYALPLLATIVGESLHIEAQEDSELSHSMLFTQPPVVDNIAALVDIVQTKDPSKFKLECFLGSTLQKELVEPTLLPLSEVYAYTLHASSLGGGFVWQQPHLECMVLTLKELGLERHQKKNTSSKNRTFFSLQTIAENDLVVHDTCGIGRYKGLVALTHDVQGHSIVADYACVEYAQQDKLYVPVDRLQSLHKYIGSSTTLVHRLGEQIFLKAKEKAKESVQTLAIHLMELYAQRGLQKGIPLVSDEAMVRDFEQKFPYITTPDQQEAIHDVYSDLASGKIMDRIIIGDVGFGKTEVAMRAAFKVLLHGMQIAVLVPTTLLAHQHEKNFKKRFEGFTARIASISRLQPIREQKKILKALAEGTIDIIIGTHRLLSSDIVFHRLGLIVLDEEHRFGVVQKEKLKSLQLNTSLLTLTATPIPRTLSMSLSGLKDMSLITTPPHHRKPIKTTLIEDDDRVFQVAIEHELSRSGQVIIVYNHIEKLPKLQERIQAISNQSSIIKHFHPVIAVLHAKMSKKYFQKIMENFYDQKIHILICTTIIEIGMDIPSANTLMICDAYQFGLASLYQLRGRVGRSDQQAYCYLIYPPHKELTKDAHMRLDALQRFIELGTGFNIASQDLEIRGGGDLLGAAQSGFAHEIGLELYLALLQETIQALQGQTIASMKDPEVQVPFSCYIDDKYIEQPAVRLQIYQNLAVCVSHQDEDKLHEVHDELKDRFGPVPVNVLNLLWLMHMKIWLRKYQVTSMRSTLQRTFLKWADDRTATLQHAFDHEDGCKDLAIVLKKFFKF